MTARLIRSLPIAALLAAGCGEKPVPRVEVQPVTGRVLAQGKPATGAVVVFVPANNPDPNAIRPRGLADDNGTYSLRTYEAADGIPPGDYLVGVRWTGPKKAAPPTVKASVDDDGGAGGFFGPPRDHFGGRYADPRKSGLKVTVTAGATELKPIVLN